MIWRPRKGQRVQCWYAERKREYVKLHGRIGIVKAIGRGRGPRNVHVEVDGVGYILPRGNIREATP